MFALVIALVQWIQRLYRYCYGEVLEELDNEQEEIQGQQRQRRNGRMREVNPQMLLTLHDLQRTMDPWIAAQFYNSNHSPLGGLPEEILLQILRCIGDDILTLCCLRRVSRDFRRLINVPGILEPPRSRLLWYSSETLRGLPDDLRKQLQQRLQKDGMCDNCILWYDVPIKRCFRSITRPENLTGRGMKSSALCKLKPETPPPLHCDDCGTYHGGLEFSYPYKQIYRRERQCLGRQGAVQLCEHIHISWATIEAHIADWQRRKPGDWKACFDQFKVECHDPSHDTRCRAEEAPTWPRALLQHDRDSQDLVVLMLEWEPHSGLDAFSLNLDGRAPATELRAMFQRYRQGPAGILFPSHPSSSLPEMACFDPTRCDCLHYEKGIQQSPSTVDPSNRSSFFRKGLYGLFNPVHLHFSARTFGSRVYIHKHSPMGNMCNPIRLVSTYQRTIPVYRKKDGNKINPTHEWLHAMDPDTYSRHAGYDLPLCEDQGCMNYYRRPKSDRHCGR